MGLKLFHFVAQALCDTHNFFVVASTEEQGRDLVRAQWTLPYELTLEGVSDFSKPELFASITQSFD